jgi:hypothetical protein
MVSPSTPMADGSSAVVLTGRFDYGVWRRKGQTLVPYSAAAAMAPFALWRLAR